MASTLTHVSSSNFFPRHRVQKLLSLALYNGLTTKIEAEGVFIQVAEDGFPVRQVFLAVTEREIFIVRQDIPESSHPVSFTCDSEISNLSIDQIVPLPVIRFLILDDRTKFFSICSDSGTRFRFEMCQLDLESEQQWERWRDAIIKLGGGLESNDVNNWRTSYVIDLSHGYGKRPELTKVKVKSPVQSISFGSGQSVGVQTENELTTEEGFPNEDTTASGDTVNKHLTRPKKYVYARPKANKNDNSDTKKKGKDTVTEPECASSSSSEYSFDDETFIGYRPSDRLTILFTAARFVPSNDSVGILRSKLRKSKSSNDLQDSQYLLCGMPSTDPPFLKKLSKVRKNVLSCKDVSMELESSSESEDDDLDKLFEEAGNTIDHNKANSLSGRELWRRVKELLVQRGKTDVVERFQDVVHQVHFRTLSYRDKTLAQSVTEFDPLDFSSQLTNISRKLFLALSLSDFNAFTRSKGEEIRRALGVILKFSEDIRKMVATEIIKSDSRPGSVKVLKFFVQVAVHLLFRHYDFQSLMAVLQGLTSLPLYRLGNKWATFFVQEPFSFCHFLTMIQLLNPKMGYAAYVSRVNTCMKRKSPFIPLLDHILDHCLKRSYHMNESSNLVNIRLHREKQNDSSSKRTIFDSNKKLKNTNDKNTCPNDLDKHMKEAKSVSIMSMLHEVRRGTDFSESSPNKEDSINKKLSDIFLKPILVNKEKRRNSISSMFFRGKKKKHRVTFQLDSDTREGNVKERSNALLKHLTKTRVKLTEVPYGEDKGIKNESRDSGDDEEIKMFGDISSSKNTEGSESSLSSVDFRLSRSPALLSFCDFKAKIILESAFKDIVDMGKSAEMSADSERESSEESDSSLEETQQYSQIQNENEVVHHEENSSRDDKINQEEDKTDVDGIEEASSPILLAEEYTPESDTSISTSGAVFNHEENSNRVEEINQEEDITDVDRKEESSSSILLAEKYTLESHTSSSEEDESTGENEIGHVSSSTLWQFYEDEMSNSEGTVNEDIDLNTDQEVSSKTKKQKKGKAKQITSLLQTLKRKFRKSKKDEVKHINTLQKDIDDIADLMSSFKTFDDKKENEGATDERTEKGDSADIETGIMLPETHRRKSYVPSIVEKGRRKSMFEEAISANTEEEEQKQAELFESLKNKRLDQLRERGSIDLLIPDEDDLNKGNNPDSVTKDSKISFIDSFTNLFRSKNASNNSAFEKVDRKLLDESKKNNQQTNSKQSCSVTHSLIENHSRQGCRSSQQSGVSLNKKQKQNSNRNASSRIINAFSSNFIQTLRYKNVGFVHDSDQTDCSLCGSKVCLYECGIGNFVINAQKSLANIGTPSRQRVKECLSSIITINNYLTNFDILQLSLYSE